MQKNQYLACGALGIVATSFISQYVVCPQYGGRINHCLTKAEDMVEKHYYPELSRQFYALDINGTISLVPLFTVVLSELAKRQF